MKKQEHDKIVKEIHQSYQQRLSDAAKFLESDRDLLLEVVDVYAETIDKQDARIAELEAMVQQLQAKQTLVARAFPTGRDEPTASEIEYMYAQRGTPIDAQTE